MPCSCRARRTTASRGASRPREDRLDNLVRLFRSGARLPDGSLILGLYTEVGKTNRAYGATIKSYDDGKFLAGLGLIGADSGLSLDAETDVIRLKDGDALGRLASSRQTSTLRVGGRRQSWGKVYSSASGGIVPISCAIRAAQSSCRIAFRDGPSLEFRRGKNLAGTATDRQASGRPIQARRIAGRTSYYCVYYGRASAAAAAEKRLYVSRAAVTLEEGN